MYALGHIGLSLLAFAPLGFALLRAGYVRVAASGTATAACLSTLPDVDQFVAWLPHRGPTHTVLFAVAVGVALGAVGSTYSRRRRRRDRPTAPVGTCLGLGGTLSVGSHLVGDVVTPMGIRPFVPFSDLHLTLALVASRNPQANALLFLAGGTTTAVSWWRGTHAGDDVAAHWPGRATLAALRARVPTGILADRSLR